MRKVVNVEVAERVVTFFKSLDISAREFEQICRLGQSAMSRCSNNKRISMDSIYRILRAYPKLNEQWILTGSEPMLLSSAPVDYTPEAIPAPVPAPAPAGDALVQGLYERLLKAKDEQIAAKDAEIASLRDEVDALRVQLDMSVKYKTA